MERAEQFGSYNNTSPLFGFGVRIIVGRSMTKCGILSTEAVPLKIAKSKLLFS